MTETEINYFTQARQVIAGGDPLFASHALGSKIYDTSDKEYIDYVLYWGPMILGHAHPEVIDAICRSDY
jgi:glutamate-1-semialdehyde 2,1-aminomutase